MVSHEAYMSWQKAGQQHGVSACDLQFWAFYEALLQC